MRRLAALITCVLGAAAASAQHSVVPRRGVIEVPVTAPHSVVRKMSARLVLRLERDAGASGTVAGWDVGVEDQRRPNDGNLLYHSRFWHGPHPSQVSAWIVRDRFYPASNTLDVRGRPWRVRIECINCVTAGEGTDSHFVSGTVRVRWSRR